ncbi:hypothetical protein AGRA3207_002051 [Actinomadura graeca]|uniref:Lipoprotein n=1 Tax=Actinomadura graeca TaxID=2750812 RepID=A0ABX8QTD5_9ACTN|nr:hypothetical protein [Actinomadura graeca]QXJ21219.1 hypothetical protein AGRA3207_002051 [Actinomadura graeca]
MGRSGKKGLRRPVLGSCIALVALLAGGCGLGTGDDKRRAAELAERHHPGQLRLIGARTLFPETGGSEVTFAVRDDPDAVVRLRIDAGKGRCGRERCEDALAGAVARGREQAAGFRLLRTAFARCGHEIIGLGPAAGEPWIAAALTNDNVTAVLGELGRCAAGWSAALTAAGSPPRSDGSYGLPAGSRALRVRLVRPDVARKRPAGDPASPTLARLTSSRLQASLAGRTYFTAAFTLRDGRDEPVTSGLAISRTFEDRQAFGRRVREQVGGRLRLTEPRAVIASYDGVWSLEPGRIDRFTGYVLFCEDPAHDRTCLGDHAVRVTVDEDGRPVSDLQIVRDVREGNGPLRLPTS